MTETRDDDVALKLLHTADWHLGRRFPSFDEPDQVKLTRARLDAVRKLLNVAERDAVDAVLCAGDIFDEPSPDRVWWQGLLDCLRERDWVRRPLFLLPGNHDPLMPRSIWAAGSALRAELPDWAHVVDRENFTYELGDEAVLYGSPCTSQAGSADLAMRLPARENGDDRIRVGMVHGRTFHAEGHQTNFPIDPEAAKKRGFDYLALGDLHAWEEVPPHRVPPTIYPSAPEPMTFGEPESGYCAVVFFSRRGRRAVVRKEKVGYWSWRKETVGDLRSLRALRAAEDLRQTVLELTVDFEVPLREYEEAQNILNELKGTDATPGRVGILKTLADGLEMDTADVESLFAGVPEALQATVLKLKLKAARQDEDGEMARTALWHLHQLVRDLEK